MVDKNGNILKKNDWVYGIWPLHKYVGRVKGPEQEYIDVKCFKIENLMWFRPEEIEKITEKQAMIYLLEE